MISQSLYKTVSCNGPGCENTVTYEASQEGADQAITLTTPWMKTLRVVQTKQGRVFAYCSDSCELGSIAAGNHNPEERKQIVLPQGANAQQQAAYEAARAEAATKAIKAGGPVTLEGR